MVQKTMWMPDQLYGFSWIKCCQKDCGGLGDGGNIEGVVGGGGRGGLSYKMGEC